MTWPTTFTILFAVFASMTALYIAVASYRRASRRKYYDEKYGQANVINIPESLERLQFLEKENKELHTTLTDLSNRYNTLNGAANDQKERYIDLLKTHHELLNKYKRPEHVIEDLKILIEDLAWANSLGEFYCSECLKTIGRLLKILSLLTEDPNESFTEHIHEILGDSNG